MRHGSLFSGIGGFDLAAAWAGFTNVVQVEIDPFCQQVLSRHFPDTERHGDIREFDGSKWRGRIDVLSGGFPCQPFSLNGKRQGREDSRYLWPEMLRVINEIRPRYVLGENVRGLITSGNLDTVWMDLEKIGYAVCPLVVPAESVGAKHRRERVWIVANSADDGREPILSSAPLHDASSTRLASGEPLSAWDGACEVEPCLCRAPDGLSDRMDSARQQRIKALGNAIVPQVAYLLFTAIKRHYNAVNAPGST